MKYLIFTIVIAATAVSCRPKNIDLDVKQAETQSVVSSQIIPTSGMVIWLTRSFSALSKGSEGSIASSEISDYIVDSADVSITYNDQKVDMLNLGSGLYLSANVQQQEGVTYFLNVKDPKTGKELTSQARAMPPIAFNYVNARVDSQKSGDTWLRVNYDFDDPAGKNYYMINLYVNLKNPLDDNGGNSPLPGNGFNPTDLNNLFTEFAGTWLISDPDESQKTINNEFTVYFQEDFSESDTVVATLSNISKDYYEFLSGQARANTSIPFLSEPVSIKSNIENGLGFFSMHFPMPYVVSPR